MTDCPGDICAEERHAGDSHGSLVYLYVACVEALAVLVKTDVGGELKTVGNYAVDRAVDYLYVLADVVGVEIFGLNHLAVPLLLYYLVEGTDLTHSEGVVSESHDVLAEDYLKASDVFLDEGEVADVNSALKVCALKSSVSEGIVADIEDFVKILYGGKGITVGECALADAGTDGVEYYAFELVAEGEGVLADVLSAREVNILKVGFAECGVAECLDVLEIYVCEVITAGERHIGDILEILAEGYGHELLAVHERLVLEHLERGEIDRGEDGVVEYEHVSVALYGVVASHSVDEGVGVVTGERHYTDLLYPTEVNVVERTAVVECHLADFCATAESNLGEICGAHKRSFANLRTLADSKAGKLGKVVVTVEAGLDVLNGLCAEVEVVRGISRVHSGGTTEECALADGYATADSYLLKLGTLTECALADNYAVTDINLGDVGEGECVLTDKAYVLNRGKLGDVGEEEGILTDICELSESDGVKRGTLGECVVAYYGNVGHIHGGDSAVTCECAEAYCGNACEIELASCLGSYEKKSLTVVGKKVFLVSRGLVGGVARLYGEGFYGRAGECVLTDSRYGRTDVYGLKVTAIVEGAGRNYVGVHRDGLKRGTAHKHVRTVLNDTTL